MFVNHHHQSLAKATERPGPSEVNPEPEPKESSIASEYGIGKINNGGNSNVPSTGISHDAGAISSVWPTSENLKALVPKMNDKDPSPNLDDCSIVIKGRMTSVMTQRRRRVPLTIQLIVRKMTKLLRFQSNRLSLLRIPMKKLLKSFLRER